jgi:AbrB family looped-hinge helix DNA binding protein
VRGAALDLAANEDGLYLTFVLPERSMSASERLTTRVSTKGQVILPKTVRRRCGWEAGTRLVVEETADGVVLRRAARFAPTTVEQVGGLLAYRGKPKTLQEMDAGVLAEARGRHARD